MHRVSFVQLNPASAIRGLRLRCDSIRSLILSDPIRCRSVPCRPRFVATNHARSGQADERWWGSVVGIGGNRSSGGGIGDQCPTATKYVIQLSLLVYDYLVANGGTYPSFVYA